MISSSSTHAGEDQFAAALSRPSTPLSLTVRVCASHKLLRVAQGHGRACPRVEEDAHQLVRGKGAIAVLVVGLEGCEHVALPRHSKSKRALWMELPS